MELNGQILSQLNIPVHIPLTELRWFYIQEKLNSFQKFISMFVTSNLTPRTFEILLSVSSLHNIIAGDLWGERGILREVRNECGARDEGRRKIKRLLPVHCSDSPTFTAWTLRSGWFNCWTRWFGIFVWPVSLEQNNRYVTYSCSFDDAVREAFRLFPNVPETKEKQNKCLNLLLKRKDFLGWLPTRSGKSLIY